ncbi:MAG: hypothetical protein ACOCO9_00815 [Segatella copri]
MEKSGFFNARKVGDTYDRTYLAEDFANYFMRFIGNGVFPNPSTGLQVLESDTPDMFVNLKTGYAFINGYTYANEGDKPFQVNVADGVLNRKDAVFIRWDRVNRAITGVYVAGQNSSDPVAPTPTRTADIWDLCVAIINVKAGSTKITQDMIEDTRMNKSLCGIVVNAVDEIDTTTLYLQVQKDLESFQNMSQAEFTAWFDSIKGRLSGDIATNLQLQLTNIMDGTSVPYSGISIYTHSKSGTVHELTGVGANGRVKMTADVEAGDTVMLNGEEVPAYVGTETFADALAGESVTGRWLTFTQDGAQINFNGGGGLSITKLALATADTGDVISGKKFYSGDKTLKEGSILPRNTVGQNGTVGINQYFSDVAVSKSDNTQTNKNLDGVSRLCLRPPAGFYDGSSYVGETFANVASAIGLTAEKLMSGQQVLGINGTGLTRAVWHGELPTDYSTRIMGTAPVSGTLLFAFVGNADHDMQIQSITIGGNEVATPQRNNMYVAQFSVVAGQQITMRWSSNYGGGTPYGYGVICYV